MTNSEQRYRHHVFICTNRRPDGHPRPCCSRKDPETLRDAMKDRVSELKLRGVRINNAGCLDHCEQAVAVVVYPEGIWYSLSTEADALEVVDRHLQNGEVVERLVIRD